MKFETENIKILVIDDSDIIRTSLKKFLSEYNVEVITCNDGLEGLQNAVESKPELIFLDLMMPNLDGIRLLRVLKVLVDVQHIPVIVISGHTDKANVLAAMKAGAERILSKPVKKQSLIMSINEVLGKDFLLNAKKLKEFSPFEKEKMSKELKILFANSLTQKMQSILKSILDKNTELLKLLVHELKGSSGTAGYPDISKICQDFEILISNPDYGWHEIISKYEMLVESIDKIETSTVN